MKSTTQGYLDLSIAQICIAANTVAAKYLLQVMPVYFYLGIRFALTFVMLSILMRIRNEVTVDENHPKGYLTRKDWALLWAGSLCAGPLFNMLLMLGMKYTTATSAGIVMSTLPAMLAIFSFFFLGERLAPRKWFAIGLAMCGLVILSMDSTAGVSGKAEGSLFGDFLVFLSVIPEALYSIFMKLLNRRVTAMGTAVISNLMSTAVLAIPFGFACQDVDLANIPWTAWWVIASTIVCSTGFYWLWARGLTVIPASTSALFASIMPVATSIIAVILLGEIFTLYDTLGMGTILASILLGTGMRWQRLKKKV